MDLRAPLHDDGMGATTPPWRRDDHDPDDGDDATPSAATSMIDPSSYEAVIRRHLCGMHAASRALGLGSESRFTGIVLFHRYVRRFHRHVVLASPSLPPRRRREGEEERRHPDRRRKRKSPPPPPPPTTTAATATGGGGGGDTNDMRRRVASHLGKVASACLLLGCKAEEEPRRMRDVVNISQVLGFSSWEDGGKVDGDDDGDGDATKDNDLKSGGADDDARRGGRRSDVKDGDERRGRSMATIVESRDPPPLDEGYWKAKEGLVSTEQHVLRMIRFDATVCHPHRCVLAIMETLGFGVGRGWGEATTGGVRRRRGDCDDDADDDVDGDGRGGRRGGGEGGRRRRDDRRWLLHPDRSEGVILGAFRMLNDAALDGAGAALRHPVVVLSCAAISLAAAPAEAGGGGGGLVVRDDRVDARGKFESDDDANAAAALPAYWWRALDVSTEDIAKARDALREECTNLEGLEYA